MNLVEQPMHWFVIKHLAEELVKRQVMTGLEVEAAILEDYDLHFKYMQKRHGKKPAKTERPRSKG